MCFPWSNFPERLYLKQLQKPTQLGKLIAIKNERILTPENSNSTVFMTESILTGLIDYGKLFRYADISVPKEDKNITGRFHLKTVIISDSGIQRSTVG